MGNDGPRKPRAGAIGVSDGIDVASSDVFLVENVEQKVGVGIRHGTAPVAPDGALFAIILSPGAGANGTRLRVASTICRHVGARPRRAMFITRTPVNHVLTPRRSLSPSSDVPLKTFWKHRSTLASSVVTKRKPMLHSGCEHFSTEASSAVGGGGSTVLAYSPKLLILVPFGADVSLQPVALLGVGGG